MVSKEARPKVVIFVNKDVVSEAQWGCTIESYWVATLTYCADEISRAQNRVLTALGHSHTEQIFYPS